MNATMTTEKIRNGCAITTQPTPAPPSRIQMIFPRGIANYPSFPERQFPTIMSATTTALTKNMIKSHKGHSVKYTLPMPSPPSGRHMIVPRGITTYQSLPDRQFPTTMNTTTMPKNKRIKSHNKHSTHARSSLQEADDSAQRYYDRPIHTLKVIPDDYDCDNNNGDK